MKVFAEHKDQVLNFDLSENGDELVVKFNGDRQVYSFEPLGMNRFSLIHNNRSHLIHIIKENGYYHVHLDGLHFPFRVEDERTRALRELVKKSASLSGEHAIRAPIPGLIRQIKVKEGEKIDQNQALFILEAMKMENEIRSEFSGIIKKISVSEGSPVEKNQVIIIISAG